MDALERASAEMLPAEETIVYDGWLLRFTPGTSRNANSVWPIAAGSLPLEEKLAYCEEAYARRRLSCSFRVADFEDLGLIGRLHAAGYREHNPNSVLTLHLSATSPEPLDEMTLHTWLDACAEAGAMSSSEAAYKRDRLSALILPTVYASIAHDDQPTVFARSVQDEGFLQIAEVWTAPEHRGKGLGTRLLRSLLDRGSKAGATTAFILVAYSNPGARRLYERLGFRDAYRFRYMIR